MSAPITAGGNVPARPPAETSSSELTSKDAAKPAENPQDSVFARTLKAKTDTATQRRGGGGLPGGAGERLEATRDEAARAPLREPGGGETGQGGENTNNLDMGSTAWEPTSLTAIAGEPRTLVQHVPTHSAASDVSSADAAARIDEIARRIVDACELHLGPQGTAAVHMELSLGALGNLRVEIARGEDGKIRLGFESSSERAAELVRTHGDELRGALEARGVSLADFTIQGPEGPTFRLEPPAGAEGSEPASRRAAETAPLPGAQNREDGSRENADERDRRHARPEPEGEEDE